MSKVVREDTGELTATITVVLEPTDYEPKFKAELKKYREQAHMKGFRKGKTPMSVIKKMYGKGVLAEVINDLLQKELNDYINKEKLNLLGQPLPSNQQNEVSFDLQSPTDYAFAFDVGMAPDFEVLGIGTDNSFEKYTVLVPDETVDEELASARKRLGENISSEGPFQEGDLLKLHAVEWDNGPKEHGIEHEFSLLIDSLQPGKKEDFLGKKAGDQLQVNIFDLEKDSSPAYVRKYFLGLDEEDDREVNETFELTIMEGVRIQEPELNDDFFKGYFGDDTEITTVEEAREKIRQNIAGYYNKQAEALLFRDIQDDLMEKNKPSLPDDFLKRLILASNENATEADIDKEFDSFTENLRWTLVRNRLVRKFELKVAQQELEEGFKDRVRGYMGQNPGLLDDSFLDQMAMRLMADEKQVEQLYEEILADKLYEALVEEVTIIDKPIHMDAFLEIIKEVQAQQASATETEEE